jgi:predicted amidohydrolase YtcJ
MIPLMKQVGLGREMQGADEAGLRAFARLAVGAGVTSATELGAPFSQTALDAFQAVTAEEDFPLRLVWLLRTIGMRPLEAIDLAETLAARSTDRLRLGAVKVVADGSIQGFSARLRAPGYFNGAENGLWYVAPEDLREIYGLALARGVQVHTHTNGDQATELALDSLEQALRGQPGPDHRFILQHCQLADAAQYRRMKALGMGVNLFANHHFYWGDLHRSVTVGPERAERMNACRTALESGVPFTIHSDAPVTPMGPLFTAWCAINRLTASGRTLGAYERIGVHDALRAVTLGAAWSLKLDAEIGSIECGKRADFAVLDADPYEVAPETLKDVPVWGVVQGGRVFRA